MKASERVWIGDMLTLDNGLLRKPREDETKHVGPMPWDIEISVKLEGIAGNSCLEGEEVTLITEDTVFDVENVQKGVGF